MLDPLTALGLASNIIQLIQFTSDLVSKSREYYDSADGSSVEQLELEVITVSLQDLSEDLVVPFNRKSKATKAEQQLADLCSGCREISDELLDLIRTLKSEGTHTRWGSFRQALKSAWKEEKITALEARLDRYRRQIDTTLLISIRESINDLSKPHREYQQVSHFFLKSEKDVERWKTELVDEVHRRDWNLQSERDVMLFSAKLSASTNGDRDIIVKRHILETLRFNSMKDRAERIPRAHEKTFDWIFRDSKRSLGSGDVVLSSSESHGTTKHSAAHPNSHRTWSNFVHWLQSDTSLYWITGKPGSGKSTLMKYLQNDSRTLKYLEPWVNGLPITHTGYFFWNSGVSMQMSKLGLLQTLLFGAVENNLDLIPIIFPRRWRSYQSFGGDFHEWSMNELVQAFQLLISDETTKFFFFIDGLDEFDGDGAELVTFIHESISSRKNIKFCVASRPWLVFEDAFKRRPSLRVEDLTAPDIQLYVTEKLNENEMFVRLDKLEHSAAIHLIDEVMEKASGVFLWVTLVILSLLEGLRDGDTMSDLHARLVSLPSDLEELFEKILRRLNPDYFEQASMYFQIVQATSEPLTLLSFYFAEAGFEKSISAKIGPDTSQEQEFCAEGMRRRLSSRCKGLLEAPLTGSATHLATVQYLHRTVRDYIRQQNVWEFVTSGTNKSFNPHILLSASWLRTIKAMPFFDLTDFWSAVKSCADHSIGFEQSNLDLQIIVLDELSRVGDQAFEMRGNSNWMNINTAAKGQWRETTNFLGYAFLHPLHQYLEYKLQKGASLEIHIDDCSLLYKASLARNVRLVRLLFSLGANPNANEGATEGWTTRSTWSYVLSGIRNPQGAAELENSEAAADIIELFLDHGADLRWNVDNETVASLIKDRFQAWNAARTTELLKKASKKARKRRKNQGQKGIETPSRMLPVRQKDQPAIVGSSLENSDSSDTRKLDSLKESLNMRSIRSSKTISESMRSIFRRPKGKV